MGAVVSFSVASSIVLALLYLMYKWLFASEKQPRYNRAVIWGIYALSFVGLPLCGVAMGFAESLFSSREGQMAITLDGITASIVDGTQSGGNLFSWVIVLYLSGAAFAMVLTAITTVRLARMIRGGEHLRCEGYVLVLTARRDVAPFSFGRFIVMNREDYGADGQIIMVHEMAHIRRCHWVDLFMAQLVAVFQWFNPAAWLMREEIKAVHEYQADAAVLAAGVNARSYQMLLIKKAVGARFPSLANSLNHSKLKKRITMMYNHQTSWRKRVGRAFAVVPALAAAVALTHIPAVAGALDAVSEASLSTKTADVAVTPQTKGKVKKISIISETSGEHSGGNAMTVSVETSGTSDAKADKQGKGNAIVVETAAVMPKFPGGEAAMMRYLMDNIKWPEGNKKTGKVVVQFIVSREGKVQDVEIIRSVDPALDAEAVRVVSAMPDFEPGRNEKGETVAVHYVLPVSFAMKGDDKDSSESKPTTLSDNVKVYIAGNPATREEMDKLDASRIKSMEVDKVNNVIHITLE